MIEDLYILGAGASVDAKAPVMNNFIDTAEDLSYSLQSGNKFEQEQSKILHTVIGKIKSLRKIQSKSQIDLNNIETVLGLLEMAELLRMNVDDSTGFASLKDSYVRLIAITLEKSMPYTCDTSGLFCPVGSYKALAEEIFRKNSEKNNAAIITFNYDLGVDAALEHTGIRYDYFLDNSNSKLLPLLKLHGSLNWFTPVANSDSDNSSKIRAFTLNDYLVHLKSTDYFYRGMDTTHYIEFSWYVQIKHKESQSIPFIIPPTWNKSMYHNQVSSVWKKAAECLSQAKNIYVIGYSLPETDAFFKFLFSLGADSDMRVRKFCVVNPDVHVGERFRNMLGQQFNNRFEFEQSYFGDYLKKITPKQFGAF